MGNHKIYLRIMSGEGKWEFHKKDSPRKRNKTSKKIGCKAKLKLPYVYDWFKQVKSLMIE